MRSSGDTDVDVIVVGGGPIGTALAIDLSQRGVSALVVERRLEPQPIPKGQNLTQRTMEHLYFWGVEDRVRAARTVRQSTGGGGLTLYGDLLSEHHYPWLQRERVRAFYFRDNERLPQWATEQSLRDRLAELGARVRYAWTATGIEQTGDRVIVAGKTADGVEESFSARYAVACDGGASRMRDAAGIAQTQVDHDQLMVLLVFRSPRLSDLLSRHPGRLHFNALHPRHEGYWQFFGRIDDDHRWFFHAPVAPGTTAETLDVDALLSVAVGAPVDPVVEHVGFWDARFAIADDYRAGRVFVAGDAAHSHPPYGGYGINSGFEDAANLAWKLEAELDGWGGTRLLDGYDAERRPVFVSTARDFIERSILDDREFLARFDPESDPDAFRAEWQRRSRQAAAEVDTFEPHYASSPLVIGGQGETGAVGRHEFRARPGHHLAPFDDGDGDVFERLGRGFTLVSSGDRDAEFAAAASAAGIPLTVVSIGASAVAHYGAREVLVRPDQFVCWVGGSDDLDAATVLTICTGHVTVSSD